MPQKIFWSNAAKAQMRAISKEDAMRILHGLTRLMKAGEGDVQRLQGKEPAELRLRIGDYRVRFREFSGAVRVLTVRHRRDVYR